MFQHSPVPIFVSSTHYGLEDLRGELVSHLDSLGTTPFLSSEAGFPDYPGMPPYAQCLKVLEECLIVVGVVDRRYGRAFEKWSPYSQYDGLSPTHAELRHALLQRRRLLIYVRDDVRAFYEVFRKNRKEFADLNLPNGLDVRSLQLFEELKTADPAPWIESFTDVRDIKKSVARRLHYDLHEALLRREEFSRGSAELLLTSLLQADPGLHKRLSEGVKRAPKEDQPQLMRYLAELEEKRPAVEKASEAEFARLLELGDDTLFSIRAPESTWETFKDLVGALVPVLLDPSTESPTLHVQASKKRRSVKRESKKVAPPRKEAEPSVRENG